MRVRDAVYGAFTLPSFLTELVAAPEFRRLAGVRLLNIDSPSLAALADVSRYSHTLGVIRLALENPLIGLSEVETKAFLAAIVVHDAATPAFAHLFEYLLKERYGWDHESAIEDLLTGKTAQLDQIFASKVSALEKICGHVDVDFKLVMQFIRREHPFSRLVFGTLDFDNLDNVARMGWMLGFEVERQRVLNLARDLGVDIQGRLVLGEEHKEDVEYWLSLRGGAYGVLVFDTVTVAGQAVLSKVMRTALDKNLIDVSDWRYPDAKFLEVLASQPALKKVLGQDFFGVQPGCCLLHQSVDQFQRLDKVGKSALSSLVEIFLAEKFGPRSTVYGYVFRDKGAFSKRVEFLTPSRDRTWSVGTDSASYVFYGFRRGHPDGDESRVAVGREFSEWLLKQI